jgi:ATP-dependent DNA helicase PIF1
MPVILTRNIGTGLCNGTKLTCVDFYPKLIKCAIATGERKGEIVYIPRMPLIPTEQKLSFILKRVQFPIKPAFAMTINKSQGQTLSFVGLSLLQPVFSHGQLYVACSRVTAKKNLKIALTNPDRLTKNIVWQQIFRKQ